LETWDHDFSTPPEPLEPAPLGWFWECDADGRYTTCSSEVEEVLGWRPEDFLGQSLVNFNLPTYAAQELEISLASAKFPAELILDFYDRQNKLRPVSFYILPTLSESGEGAGWHGFALAIPGSEGDQLVSDNLESVASALAIFAAVQNDLALPEIENPFSEDYSMPGITEDPQATDEIVFNLENAAEDYEEDSNRLPEEPQAADEIAFNLENATADHEEVSDQLPEESGSPQLELPVDSAFIEEKKSSPAKTTLQVLAIEKIIETLNGLRNNSPYIKETPLSRIRVKERQDWRSDTTQTPTPSGKFGEQEVFAYPKILVQEIEYHLEWGNKFDFNEQEIAYIASNKFKGSGLRGIVQKRFAPKEILKCDYFWIAVLIVVEKSSSEFIWVNFRKAKIESQRIDLDLFLQDPRILLPIVYKGLAKPWRSKIKFQVGVDYLADK